MVKPSKFFAGLTLALTLFSARSVSADSASMTTLIQQQAALTQKINSNRSKVADLTAELKTLNAKISSAQQNSAEQARAVQTSDLTTTFLNSLLESKNFADFIQQVVNVNLITSAANQRLVDWQTAKNQKTQALADLKTSQAALDVQSQEMTDSLAQMKADEAAAQAAAVAAAQAKNTTTPSQSSSASSAQSSAASSSAASSSSSSSKAPATKTPSSSSVAASSSANVTYTAPALNISESQARANIVARESGGNYQATNGRYYGAYQLDISSLGGDLSPAHQDTVAQSYVVSRYGSWAAAWTFWQAHGWY
ncbi:MAG: peptidoglycan-binding protein LysM [Streptococcaceae bacterium]|jgi:peptidoglycan hydrolase CwlO-like protein|nr:peptidoglycan-binding protein LysM [Streptococcaceae bacterium]